MNARVATSGLAVEGLMAVGPRPGAKSSNGPPACVAPGRRTVINARCMLTMPLDVFWNAAVPLTDCPGATTLRSSINVMTTGPACGASTAASNGTSIEPSERASTAVLSGGPPSVRGLPAHPTVARHHAATPANDLRDSHRAMRTFLAGRSRTVLSVGNDGLRPRHHPEPILPGMRRGRILGRRSTHAGSLARRARIRASCSSSRCFHFTPAAYPPTPVCPITR